MDYQRGLNLYPVQQEAAIKNQIIYTAERRPELLSAHLFQIVGMRGNGLTHFGVFVVWNTKLLTGLLYNFADGRVVYVRNFREKMVFNLEIQSTQ